MSLKYMELRYDRELNKWVWVDIRTASPVSSTEIRRRYSLLRTGFYPHEFNFLKYIKENNVQCSYCGIFKPTRQLTRDHIYPKSLGGEITTPSCRPCNEVKSNRKPIEWAIYLSENELDIVHYKEQAEVA